MAKYYKKDNRELKALPQLIAAILFAVVTVTYLCLLWPYVA